MLKDEKGSAVVEEAIFFPLLLLVLLLLVVFPVLRADQAAREVILREEGNHINTNIITNGFLAQGALPSARELETYHAWKTTAEGLTSTLRNDNGVAFDYMTMNSPILSPYSLRGAYVTADGLIYMTQCSQEYQVKLPRMLQALFLPDSASISNENCFSVGADGAEIARLATLRGADDGIRGYRGHDTSELLYNYYWKTMSWRRP